MNAKKSRQLQDVANILGRPVKEVKKMYRDGTLNDAMDKFDEGFKQAVEDAKMFGLVEGDERAKFDEIVSKVKKSKEGYTQIIDRIPVDDEQQ